MTANRCAILTWLFASTLSFASAQSTAPATGRNLKSQLDLVVQREGAAFIKEPTRVGLSIGIIKDKQTYFYNFGTTEKGTNKAPTQNTVYEIGSVSKTFASLLLAQAVAEKRLSLEDDVRNYLKGAYPNLAYAGKPIKLLHLANTTSALPDNLPDRSAVLQQANPDSIPALILRAARTYTKQNFYDDLHTVKLDTVPGLIPRHSNAGAQLLAYILENVYQTPYEKLVEKYIEKPLHMQSATSVKAGNNLLAVGHNEKGSRMPYHFIDNLEPSGGLRYSAADMVKYLAFQLAETNKAVVLSHQPTWGSLEEEAIGLNWNMRKTADSKRQLLHTGGTFGFASYCSFYPELGFGIVVLSNESDRGTQGRLYEVADQIVAGIYGVPPGLQAFQSSLATSKYNQALDVYKAVKKKHPDLHLTEEYVNEWGYKLARAGNPKQAIELFKLNVSLHPNSWNTYDSLAEAYEMTGNNALAISNYKQSLALNPKNTGAVEHLKKLGATANK
ncbi:serine hydrolase domain-containing protein [Hymenobacter volaticus]|uniref:Beta-lactamase n=1 Tax=Hymenobacter volaticus TaxID=2932254 RepID=A0ABY4G172_9BACT|nr:serine hydrolase domain-containing protein [Hymenobacter volaticus]UOQ64344.1 serine hydrolase [Hymenobacter volaticus]